jgi:oligopeptide/dipeptide ABC transporter ATP-binding protein
VVDGVSLTVGEGERIGLVGESGSGKTLTALACLGLAPEPGKWTGGSVKVNGVDIAGMSEAQMQRLRGSEIGLLQQEAVEALNPVYTIGFQLEETISVHCGVGPEEAHKEALGLLRGAALEVPSEIMDAYPHELSGGQAQRVILALSLAGRPRTLIADEPTSALDSLTQAQVIDLLNRLVTDRKMGLLLISHDLAIVERIVDRVVVLFAGRVVEEGATNELFSEPLHPYTQQLLASIPGRRRKTQTDAVRASQVENGDDLQGCRYAVRCRMAEDTCWENEPDLTELGGGRRVRCPLALADRHGDHADG